MVQKLKPRTRGLTFEIVFFVEPDGDRYHAWSPMLPGLHADGVTPTEAIQRAQELAQLYLKVLIEDGDPIPVGLVEVIPPEVQVHKKTVVVSVS